MPRLPSGHCLLEVCNRFERRLCPLLCLRLLYPHTRRNVLLAEDALLLGRDTELQHLDLCHELGHRLGRCATLAAASNSRRRHCCRQRLWRGRQTLTTVRAWAARLLADPPECGRLASE